MHGFTLIEILSVVAIISVLLVAAVPIFANSSNSARQASREIIKAHIQQARAHAIATGVATAVAIPELSSDDELGASAMTLFEVEKGTTGLYIPLTDASGNDEQLQRWEKLPGNFHFLTGTETGSTHSTVMDTAPTMDTNFKESISTKAIIFAPNGQIVRPASGTAIIIAIAQGVKRNNALTLTDKNDGELVFEIFEVNRLTGRTRFIEP